MYTICVHNLFIYVSFTDAFQSSALYTSASRPRVLDQKDGCDDCRSWANGLAIAAAWPENGKMMENDIQQMEVSRNYPTNRPSFFVVFFHYKRICFFWGTPIYETLHMGQLDHIIVDFNNDMCKMIIPIRFGISNQDHVMLARDLQ